MCVCVCVLYLCVCVCCICVCVCVCACVCVVFVCVCVVFVCVCVCVCVCCICVCVCVVPIPIVYFQFLGNKSDFEKYAIGYYWAVVTTTQVGYGDIIAYTNIEVSKQLTKPVLDGFDTSKIRFCHNRIN